MLSVCGKTQVEKKSTERFSLRRGLFKLGKGATLAALLFTTMRGEGASVISGYDYYREAGSPEMGKVVWDERSRQYGIWSQPGGDRVADVDEHETAPTPRQRPSRPAARVAKPKPRAAQRNEERTEAGCGDCAIAGATSTRGAGAAEATGRAGREILKVAGAAAPKKKTPPKKQSKRTPEVEAEEDGEYDKIDRENEPSQEKVVGKPGKFVESLLKNARTEAYRSRRKTSKGWASQRYPGAPLGMCLQGVRMALQRTKGVSTSNGIGLMAKNAGPALRQFGYSKAGAGKYKPSTAPLGAILIYDAPGQPGKAGHIEIKGRNGYYSDYYNSRPISELMPGRRRLIGIYLPPKN